MNNSKSYGFFGLLFLKLAMKNLDLGGYGWLQLRQATGNIHAGVDDSQNNNRFCLYVTGKQMFVHSIKP